MRSTGFYLARPTHDGVPRQAGRQGHGSDTSPTQIIGFARGPLSAHSLIHQPRQRPVFIPYPLDDGFVLREGMFLHITTAGNTYLIMLLFRGALGARKGPSEGERKPGINAGNLDLGATA